MRNSIIRKQIKILCERHQCNYKAFIKLPYVKLFFRFLYKEGYLERYTSYILYTTYPDMLQSMKLYSFFNCLCCDCWLEQSIDVSQEVADLYNRWLKYLKKRFLYHVTIQYFLNGDSDKEL